MRSRGQQPRVWTRPDRKWFRTSALVQPASSRALAKTGRQLADGRGAWAINGQQVVVRARRRRDVTPQGRAELAGQTLEGPSAAAVQDAAGLCTHVGTAP